MCGIKKKNGKDIVVFSDGSSIAVEDLKLENLTEEQLRELQDLHLLNELSIRKRLHEHGNALQRIENALFEIKNNIDKFDEFKKDQFRNCPVNTKAIERIVDERIKKSEEVETHLNWLWWEIFKKKVLDAKKLIMAFLFLGGLLYTLISITNR